MSSTSVGNFGKIRSFLWPIHRSEIKRFFPLLVIYVLICFNYSLLRVIKDSLVITAPKSGAEALPFIKVAGVLPMAILSTIIFTKLANRFSQEKVFYCLISGFLVFFAIFITFLYPFQDTLHPHALADHFSQVLPRGFAGFISSTRNWTFSLFYIMAELWGTTIMTVLFWGFANNITPIGDAKRFYGILGVGANLGTIAAGQFNAMIAKQNLGLHHFFQSDPWGEHLGNTVVAIIISGIGAIILFRWYHKNVLADEDYVDSYSSTTKDLPPKQEKIKMSLRKNFSYLAKSKYLICIAVIVLTYNVSMNMIEIAWKDQVKLLIPDPAEYSAYSGKVMTLMATLATVIGLFFCGNIIKKFGWTFSALITPCIILITGGLFFTFMLVRDTKLGAMLLASGVSPLSLAVFFGAMQNSLSRACKYTLFDATKEIAFIPLSRECKLKGKAAIDGVGSRLGKSGGSFLHVFLLMIFGSVAPTAPYVSLFLLIVIAAYIIAAKSLGKQFNELTERSEKIDIPEGQEAKTYPGKTAVANAGAQ